MKLLSIVGWAAAGTLFVGGGLCAYGAVGMTYEIRPDAEVVAASERVEPAAPAGAAERAAPASTRAFGVSPDPEHFEVRLTPIPSAAAGEAGLVKLSILNRSNAPVTFVTPQDGSEWGWVDPVYELEAYDADGTRLPMRGRCGNVWAKLDEQSARTIAPGEVFATTLDLSYVDGDVARVRVRYRFDSARAKKMASGEGSVRSLEIAQGPEMQTRLSTMFNGQLESELVRLSAEPAPL